MIINSATLNGIKTSFNVIFNKAFTEAPSQYKAIAMDVPSTAAENTYAWLGMTTKFREWVGDRVIQNLETHGYTIRNKKFENTIGVSEDDIEDDNLGVYTPLIQNLGYDAKVHPDELVFGLLEKGTDNKCYDGQYFFDTDHPVGKEKTSVSNFYTGSKPAWYLIDASRPVKPIVFQKRKDYHFQAITDSKSEIVFKEGKYLYGVHARVNAGYALWQMAACSKEELTQANFTKVYQNMCALKADNGKALAIKPTILLVSPTNFIKANELITSDRLANGESNPIKNLVKVVMCPFLSD